MTDLEKWLVGEEDERERRCDIIAFPRGFSVDLFEVDEHDEDQQIASGYGITVADAIADALRNLQEVHR